MIEIYDFICTKISPYLLATAFFQCIDDFGEWLSTDWAKNTNFLNDAKDNENE